MKRVWIALALIATLTTSAGAFAAPASESGGQGQGNGPASHIIVFNEDVDVDSAVADLARAHGLGVTNVYRYALRGMAAVVPEGRLNALQRDSRVAYVEADQEVQLFVQTVPTGIQRIFADANANITIDGNDDLRIDVDVAVIDTGIDFDHPDLNVVARTDCSGGSPFKQKCKNNSGDDGNGHGTHVAGTIAAIDDGSGVVGVAPGARLWAVKVLKDDGSGWISWIIAGIDYVTDRADEIEVVNMSLGCECSSSAMDQAISNSVDAGIVYAVAGGNNDKDASTFSPANHPDVITVSALADFDGVPGGVALPTCRVDQDDTLADFSNFGNLIEVTAPGVCIFSTWKDGGYNTISGTSMASPHVAGAAGLLASGANDPTDKADVDAIRQAIIDTGNFNWTDDSGDVIQEPLLDVSNSTVFAPATVAGEGRPSEPDTTAPLISNVAFGNINDTSVDITWGTDEASDSVVNYGTTTALGFTASIADSVTSHLVGLSGLTAETTYYYEVQSTDSSANTATDNNGVSYYSFTTAAASSPDTTAPLISNVVSGNFNDTSADITWDTDEASDSVVKYGTTTALGFTASIADSVASHLVGLSGLTAETTYYYEVQSTDSSANTATDNNGANYYTFTTAAASSPDTTVSVVSITYATEGGKAKDKHLLITVALLDDLGNEVAGASVSIDLFRDDSFVASGTGTTGTDGTVTFSLKNAPSGTYTTEVTEVTADGLTWDATTPANEFNK